MQQAVKKENMSDNTNSSSSKFLTIRDIDVQNKIVLLRADLNVPKHNNHVTDTTRIERLKPTIDNLRKRGAKILIISHFGRPDGANNSEMSLAFLAPVLEKIWECPVSFARDCIGEQTKETAKNLKSGDVLLLENVRFYKQEEKNDNAFAQTLAQLGDIYVNDAFSCAHRAHASTAGLAAYLPSVAGLLMEEELNALTSALVHPQKPVAAVTGGSKISTKLSILNNLVEKMDFIILGGAMANTFLVAKGYDVGKSMYEKNMIDQAKDILKKGGDYNCEIILPLDVIVVKELKENAPYQAVDIEKIPADSMAIDLGPQTIAYINSKIENCKTVLWNGPLGVFEIKPFDCATNAVAKFVAQQTQNGQCLSIAGGGDTISALENAQAVSGFSYISTAGGAFLEWLEGRELPGVSALKRS